MKCSSEETHIWNRPLECSSADHADTTSEVSTNDLITMSASNSLMFADTRDPTLKQSAGRAFQICLIHSIHHELNSLVHWRFLFLAFASCFALARRCLAFLLNSGVLRRLSFFLFGIGSPHPTCSSMEIISGFKPFTDSPPVVDIDERVDLSWPVQPH